MTTTRTTTTAVNPAYPSTIQANAAQIDHLLERDLTLKQLIALSRTVKETPTISTTQQTKILQNISKRIWQRSVCEYDGY